MVRIHSWSSCLAVLLSTIASPLATWATVILNSSAVSVCPGDTLVFTCTTPTGLLIWYTSGTVENAVFFGPEQLNSTESLGIFTLSLINIAGNTSFVSTATVYNVSIEDDGTIIVCSDSIMNQTKKVKVKTSDTPFPPPFNLRYIPTTSTLSSVTISWVAPLDMPLCVHSYTVTVRNSCNSSQVMVYNTTDNRSSLSITDLTSDGEYSVTVAGSDGEGRLGQESNELIVSKVPQIVILGYGNYPNFVRLNWKLLEQLCYPLVHYLVTHNVSSDQSPITTNSSYVSLYGVEPGKTYTLEITPYVQLRGGEPKMFTIFREITHFNNCLLTTIISPTPSSNARSNESLQLWTIVVWILLAVINAIAMISCCIQIIMRVRSKLKSNKMTVEQRCSIVKTSSNEVESSYTMYDDINAQRLTRIPDKGAETTQTRIYSELKDVADTPITTNTNISYTAVKKRAL